MATVGNVSLKLPEPLPLKGSELDAKARGDAPRTNNRPKIVGIRNLMGSRNKNVRIRFPTIVSRVRAFTTSLLVSHLHFC